MNGEAPAMRANPVRHRLIRNPSGDRHVRRQACLIGVSWYTPAISNSVAPTTGLVTSIIDEMNRSFARRRWSAVAPRLNRAHTTR